MTICTHEAQPNPFQVGFVVIQLESISKVVSYCLNCWKVRQKMATTARPPHAGNAKEKLPSTEHQAYCQMAEKKSRNNVRVHQITYTHNRAQTHADSSWQVRGIECYKNYDKWSNDLSSLSFVYFCSFRQPSSLLCIHLSLSLPRLYRSVFGVCVCVSVYMISNQRI